MSRTPHRYRNVVTTYDASTSTRSRYTTMHNNPTEQMQRSIAHAQGWRPSDLTRAALAEIMPQLNRSECFTLLEDLGRDTTSTLRHLLNTFTLGPALRQLVQRALDNEQRRDNDWLLR